MRSIDRITKHLLPEWLQQFSNRNKDYGDKHRRYGAKGQFLDISRKVGKLERAIWEDKPLTGEQPREVILDCIGHLFLLLDCMDDSIPVPPSILVSEPIALWQPETQKHRYRSAMEAVVYVHAPHSGWTCEEWQDTGDPKPFCSGMCDKEHTYRQGCGLYTGTGAAHKNTPPCDQFCDHTSPDHPEVPVVS